MKGFADLMDLLSEEKRVTCSAIKPLIEIINNKTVTPKMSDTLLTVEVKECIKRHLNTQYQNETMSLLLDTCATLDPCFKDRFSMEDEPVMKLMDEIKAYGEVLKAGERSSQDGYRHHQRNKGKFSSMFDNGSASSCTSSTNAGTASVSDQFKHEFEMHL